VAPSSWTGAAALAVGLAAALAPSAAADGLYLYGVPTTSGSRRGPLRIRTFVPDPGALAGALPAAVHPLGADYAEIELAPGAYPELEPRSPEDYRAASFLIDYDEPSVGSLERQLVAQHGAAPSLEALRRFAADAIPRKSMERGWDTASRVAREGTGDCTEHAVLLAALARAVGRPARVALGLLVVEIDGAPAAFGHAWAEVHDGEHWVPVDATPVGRDAEILARLPLLILADEGPGYLVALGRGMQRVWARRVEVSGSP
jgi:hypothetical protein